MTRIAHLTSVHSPFDVRIFMKECRSLAKSGFDVVLIAPHDRDECVDGVQIRAVPKPLRGRLERATKTSRAVYQAALRERADIYHLHDPELLPYGVLLKLRGKRVIYDSHENVPTDILSKEHLPRATRHAIAAVANIVERSAGRIFDGIVGVNQVIVGRFPARKSICIANYALADEFGLLREEGNAAREPLMVYIGGLTRVRGMCQVVEALSLLPPSSPIRAAFAGEFAQASFEQEIRSMEGAVRLDILGFLSRPDVGSLLTRSRAGLLPLLPSINFNESSPNKLFEYMAAGLPVIASDLPGIRRIVEDAGCGLLVDPMEPLAMADAMVYLDQHPVEAEEMGRRGRMAMLERFNWDVEAARLIGFYRSLLRD